MSAPAPFLPAPASSFADQLAGYQRRFRAAGLPWSQPALADVLEVSPRLIFSWLKGTPPQHTITAEGALARLEKTLARHGK